MPNTCVYRVDWTEHERGWGCRPDGYSLHRSRDDADKYIADYWDRMPKDHVPDEYSRNGEPYIVELDDLVTLAEVMEKRSIRKWR